MSSTAKVTLPALGEGKFVVQINVLDLNQKPVATYNYNWLIDVTLQRQMLLPLILVLALPLVTCGSLD